jgi:hypothetical protein
MTDSELIKTAKSIDRHFDAVRSLVAKIRESNHPNAQQIIDEFWDNEIPPLTSAEDCIFSNLKNKDRYKRDASVRRKTK